MAQNRIAAYASWVMAWSSSRPTSARSSKSSFTRTIPWSHSSQSSASLPQNGEQGTGRQSPFAAESVFEFGCFSSLMSMCQFDRSIYGMTWCIRCLPSRIGVRSIPNALPGAFWWLARMLHGRIPHRRTQNEESILSQDYVSSLPTTVRHKPNKDLYATPKAY